jgi:hypothetical protein
MLLAAVYLAALAGLSMGLVVSAIAKNSDQAVAIVPLLPIQQVKQGTGGRPVFYVRCVVSNRRGK